MTFLHSYFIDSGKKTPKEKTQKVIHALSVLVQTDLYIQILSFQTKLQLPQYFSNTYLFLVNITFFKIPKKTLTVVLHLNIKIAYECH